MPVPSSVAFLDNTQFNIKVVNMIKVISGKVKLSFKSSSIHCNTSVLKIKFSFLRFYL